MRWAVSYRYIENQISRARQRTTLTYQFLPRFRAGIEWNPEADADDTSPLANLLAVTESKTRPALVLGTSSDRIGTPDGQAYYATLSKDLSTINGWPVAPYLGVAYGTFDDRWRTIGGVRFRVPDTSFSSTVIYDGVNIHPTVDFTLRDRHVFTLLWVDTQEVGVSYSISF